jgi:hypothetical protein
MRPGRRQGRAPKGETIMNQWARLTDRVMGYLGLALLGAVGWVAEHAPSSGALPRTVTGPKPGPTARRARA